MPLGPEAPGGREHGERRTRKCSGDGRVGGIRILQVALVVIEHADRTQHQVVVGIRKEVVQRRPHRRCGCHIEFDRSAGDPLFGEFVDEWSEVCRLSGRQRHRTGTGGGEFADRRRRDVAGGPEDEHTSIGPKRIPHPTHLGVCLMA